jgi:large subunit ribosomal protein L9
MATKLVLLERVENLGQLGDIVTVRPGYARNFLLPQKKALRASKENIAYFEAQKKSLEASNEKRKIEAEKLAKKLDGIKVPLIRQASEAGQLFGSVTARDIAIEITKESGEKVERHMVTLNQNYKLIGLFPVDVDLHPEVKVKVIVNIARSPEEALTQAKTGRALIADDSKARADAQEAALENVLEDSALQATREREAAEASESEQANAEASAKSEARKAKKKAKPKAEDSAEDAAAESTEG